MQRDVNVDAGKRYDDAELRDARASVAAAAAALDGALATVRAALGKPKLAWKHLRSGAATLEYLVEVPRREADSLLERGVVGAEWTVVSETKELRRFEAPGVGPLVAALKVARETRSLRAAAAYASLVARVDDAATRDLAAIFDLVGDVDALRSLGALAREPGWCLPEIADGGALDLAGIKHPTLPSGAGAADDALVGNDASLAAGHALVLTGPNAGGKSSCPPAVRRSFFLSSFLSRDRSFRRYARAVALAVVFAQAGGPVFAASARVPCFDAVLTRMGAADDLAAGTSTFLHELNRASFALRTATDRSLVILDELGRGTATHDGVAVAGATLAHLVSVARATTIFVTHYHGLAAAAAAEHPGRVANAHMAYATTRGNGDRLRLDDDVVMLYALEPGLCDDSFGLHAARAAGMPRRVLDVAQAKADDLEARGA